MPAVESPTTSIEAARTDVGQLPPLEAEAELTSLALNGFGPMVVCLPSGARAPRPVVVALHAHAVRPEHACTRWHKAAHGWPFLLCPLGLPQNAGPSQAVTLGSVAYTAREIANGLQALRARFGAYVSDGPPILVGWSHGAKIAVLLAMHEPQTFGSIVLGEGAYDLLGDATVASLAQYPGRRLLLLCSTLPCESTYANVQNRCARAGLACRVAGAGGHEHPFDGAVVETAQQAWPWLVQGDTRFISP